MPCRPYGSELLCAARNGTGTATLARSCYLQLLCGVPPPPRPHLGRWLEERGHCVEGEPHVLHAHQLLAQAQRHCSHAHAAASSDADAWACAHVRVRRAAVPCQCGQHYPWACARAGVVPGAGTNRSGLPAASRAVHLVVSAPQGRGRCKT